MTNQGGAIVGSPIIANLLMVFGSFIVSILVFAFIYYWLYGRSVHHFSFNAEILKRQKVLVEERCKAELTDLVKNMSLLGDLESALTEKNATILAESAPNDVFLPSGRRYAFGVVSGRSTSTTACYVSVSNEKGERIGFARASSLPEKDAHDFLQVAKDSIEGLKREAAALQKQITELPLESPPGVWEFWDFVYFSTIVQTTIGLGDILPNSTLIRLLVIFQVLGGYAILVVAVNAVVGH